LGISGFILTASAVALFYIKSRGWDRNLYLLYTKITGNGKVAFQKTGKFKTGQCKCNWNCLK